MAESKYGPLLKLVRLCSLVVIVALAPAHFLRADIIPCGDPEGCGDPGNHCAAQTGALCVEDGDWSGGKSCAGTGQTCYSCCPSTGDKCYDGHADVSGYKEKDNGSCGT